jgi:DNA-binding XRE family transcriptional regulator
MNKLVNDRRDHIDDCEWKVQKKRKMRDALKEKLAEALKVKETTIKSNIERNPQTEEDYYQ